MKKLKIIVIILFSILALLIIIGGIASNEETTTESKKQEEVNIESKEQEEVNFEDNDKPQAEFLLQTYIDGRINNELTIDICDNLINLTKESETNQGKKIMQKIRIMIKEYKKYLETGNSKNQNNAYRWQVEIENDLKED